MICGKPEYKDVITPQLNSLANFFETNPAYQGVAQLTVDLDVIEVNTILSKFQTILLKISHDCHLISNCFLYLQVNDGWFFMIEDKVFKRDIYDKNQLGIITPRLYLPYQYHPGKIPNPVK